MTDRRTLEYLSLIGVGLIQLWVHDQTGVWLADLAKPLVTFGF